MLGALLGDIVGSIYEFHNIKTKHFPLFQADSTFTDDSVMTMAVADWLLRDRDRTAVGLIASMEHYYQLYPAPMGGYGIRFHKWLQTPTADKQPYFSFGNGAAMRVAPCGWVAYSLEEAEELARRSAEVTHNHPEGLRGAQSVAAAICLLRHHTSKQEVQHYLETKYGYDLSLTCDALRPTYAFDETCQGTIPAAWAAFAESDSIEDAVRNAVSLGGDSDTVACITGALAEACYGSCPTTCSSAILNELTLRLPPSWWQTIRAILK